MSPFVSSQHVDRPYAVFLHVHRSITFLSAISELVVGGHNERCDRRITLKMANAQAILGSVIGKDLASAIRAPWKRTDVLGDRRV
ncbi:hypothetical protein G3O06_05355 [Burkholderia sp. Ac-20345]|uniref:hypothetical protein n=1 Tax=Burkholderia TaxID=32008 RepID=UPI001588B005|nr:MULTISPECIES: hypothetical protein [Burkholderia]MBN3776996.1 hypothetical protein [Burkholderia sp. Ac-20345]